MAGEKFLKNVSGAVTETAAVQSSAGAADAGKIIAADSTGHLDVTFLPTGVGPDVASITASEVLAAGAWVNVYNLAGAARARNADGSVAGKRPDGFVKSAVSNGATATVYFGGLNDAVTGQTVGDVYLTTTPGVGGPVGSIPTAAGNVQMRIGVAISATAVSFKPTAPITLA